MNLYEELGVSPDATQTEIKQAYRRLANKYHPDKQNGDTKDLERFHRIQEAYETLADPVARDRYDRTGESSEGAKQFDKNVETMVSAGILNLMQIHDFEAKDYITMFLNTLQENEDHVKAQLHRTEKALERLAYLVDNIDGGGVTAVEQGLAQKYDQMTEEMESYRGALRMIQRAREMVKGCRYTGQTPGGGWNSGFFTTGV